MNKKKGKNKFVGSKSKYVADRHRKFLSDGIDNNKAIGSSK